MIPFPLDTIFTISVEASVRIGLADEVVPVMEYDVPSRV
jgi:hypothetical protein